MQTIWDPGCRNDILARFEKLTADRRPKWGQMSCSQMLAHVVDPLRAAMGETPAALQPGLFRNPIVRYAVIYWLPWPKGAPTAPEFVQTGDPDFNQKLAELRQTLERFAASDEHTRRPHPMFGDLSHKAWGRLTFRHLNHHLRQFGV